MLQRSHVSWANYLMALCLLTHCGEAVDNHSYPQASGRDVTTAPSGAGPETAQQTAVNAAAENVLVSAADASASIEQGPPACEEEDEAQVLRQMHLLQVSADTVHEPGSDRAQGAWAYTDFHQYPPQLSKQVYEMTTVISPFMRPFGGYVLGYLGMHGRRAPMEDRISVYESAATHVIALLDGHSGDAVVNAAAATLPQTVGQFVDALTPRQRAHAGCVSTAIQQAFAGSSGPTRSVSQVLAELSDGDSGATALVAVFVDDAVYVANLGRSAAFASSGFGHLRRLTLDHSAEREISSIVRRGGYVATGINDDTPRLNGILTASRALGDIGLPVGRVPDVIRVDGPVDQLVFTGYDLLRSAGTHYLERIMTGKDSAEADPAAKARFAVSFAYEAGAFRNLSAIVLEKHAPL